MQGLFESLYNLNESDFFDRVNLHIHTNCSDGLIEPQEALKQAKKMNLKIISFTDHNSVQAYNHVSSGNYEGLQLISGVEFDCWHKSNFIHILGYGIDIHNIKIQNLCAKNSNATKLDIIRFFNKRNAGEVIQAIKGAGGIAVLAHPACCWNINLKKMIKELMKFGLEGVETYYPYIRHRGIVKFHSIQKIIDITKELNLVMTGGTDCHNKNLKLSIN
ncbi:MAG: PHP domain-containing protein [Candidatus Gastranaerophilales bacterium]|nr:PHP domain-containing protein [Candidatus Gastranaerophilales bacterium]